MSGTGKQREVHGERQKSSGPHVRKGEAEVWGQKRSKARKRVPGDRRSEEKDRMRGKGEAGLGFTAPTKCMGLETLRSGVWNTKSGVPPVATRGRRMVKRLQEQRWSVNLIQGSTSAENGRCLFASCRPTSRSSYLELGRGQTGDGDFPLGTTWGCP